MSVVAVTEGTFQQEVIQAEGPVLIDFYADWCAPCKQLSPIVEEVARELEGKLKVVKVDLDQAPRLQQMFRIRSIPTLSLLQQGQIVDQREGLLPKEAILEMVRPALPANAAELRPEDLAKLLQARRAVPVDTRDAASFRRARIPGAVHVALAEVPSKGRELAPRDGRLRVLYGRSTDEAREAAEGLRSSGVEVAFLEGGFLHWEADGLGVERG